MQRERPDELLRRLDSLDKLENFIESFCQGGYDSVDLTTAFPETIIQQLVQLANGKLVITSGGRGVLTLTGDVNHPRSWCGRSDLDWGRFSDLYSEVGDLRDSLTDRDTEFLELKRQVDNLCRPQIN